MTICIACQGNQRAAIDEALMAGMSVRAVAASFGLTKSSIQRHKAACLQPRIAAAARIVAPATEVRSDVLRAKALLSGEAAAGPDDHLQLGALLARMARSLERLEGAADTAAGASMHQSLAALSSQLHRGVETAARLQGIGAAPKEDGPGKFSLTISLPSPAAIADASRNITPRGGVPDGAEPFSLSMRFHEPGV